MTVPAEVEELIENAPLSTHVATSVDDRPHVAPVWYLYGDGVVSFVTGGRKHTISLLVDGHESGLTDASS